MTAPEDLLWAPHPTASVSPSPSAIPPGILDQVTAINDLMASGLGSATSPVVPDNGSAVHVAPSQGIEPWLDGFVAASHAESQVRVGNRGLATPLPAWPPLRGSTPYRPPRASRSGQDPDASHADTLSWNVSVTTPAPAVQPPRPDPTPSVAHRRRGSHDSDSLSSAGGGSDCRTWHTAHSTTGPPGVPSVVLAAASGSTGQDNGGSAPDPNGSDSSTHSNTPSSVPPVVPPPRANGVGGGDGGDGGSSGGSSNGSSSSSSRGSSHSRRSRRHAPPIVLPSLDFGAMGDILAASHWEIAYMNHRKDAHFPKLGGISPKAVHQWLVAVSQTTQHPAWHVNGQPISSCVATPEGEKTVTADFARCVVASASSCREAKDRVHTLITATPTLTTLGPEVLLAIVDDLIPTSAENYHLRYADVFHTIQGNCETCKEYLTRIKFSLSRFAQCEGGYVVPDMQVRDLLYNGIHRGPYGKAISGLFKAIGSDRTLPRAKCAFQACTSMQFAEAADHYLLSKTQNKFFQDGKLVEGETVEFIQPDGPSLRFKAPTGFASAGRSVGQARRAGATSAATPPASVDLSSEDALCEAVAKFENGVPTAEQLKAFHRRYSCPFCLYMRKDSGSSDRPSGWHHFAKCPHKPLGYTVTFDGSHLQEDRNGGSGFAPVSRAGSTTPSASGSARRASAPAVEPPRASTPGPTADTPTESKSDVVSRPSSPTSVMAHPPCSQHSLSPVVPPSDVLAAPLCPLPGSLSMTVNDTPDVSPIEPGNLSPRVHFSCESAICTYDPAISDLSGSITSCSTTVFPELKANVASVGNHLGSPPVEVPAKARACTAAASSPIILYPYDGDAASTDSQSLPCRFLKGLAHSTALPSKDLLCIDSGTTFSMSGNRDDFESLEPVSNTFISMANGDSIPVAGRGTVRLTLGTRIVREANWLYVPPLAMRLKSVRLHRRLHPDAYFLATHDECILGYPTFSLDVDDTDDCVIACSPAPEGSVPDFTDPVLTPNSPVVTAPDHTTGMAFATLPGTRAGRRFTPFPHSSGSYQAHQTATASSRPSTREIPSQFVPNSASPSVERFTNFELHKLFGNRRILDWKSFETVCQGGKVCDLGEVPLTVGNFVNIKRGRRGKKAKIPPVGHTLCMDIGFGDGISPGGHRYCLVVVDSGSRMCWCYGLRDLSGSTVADALLQLFVDMGQDLGHCEVRRVLCDFDPKLMRGQARHLLHRKEIRILSSAPYRQSQNGLVESHWATAVRMARAYLQEANLPKRFWFWALRTAFERMNMIPVEVGKNEDGTPKLSTPFELFYRRQPDLRTLFPFGSVGYFRRETDSIEGEQHARTKFQAQTFPGIALGRSDETNGMIFWSPETCRFSVSADYKLDTERQVRTHWPDLLNDGGFQLHMVTRPPDYDHTARFTVGDIVVFQPEGPCTSTGDVPHAHGMVVSVPIAGQQADYRLELPDGTFVDLPPDSLLDITDLDDYKSIVADQSGSHHDPADGDPIHPWKPSWMKPGQAVTYHQHGQRLLGHLHLSDNFRWAFTQADDRGRRVTEIELPNLSTDWKTFLDEQLLEIGHTTSNWAPGTSANSTKHVPTLAEPLTRGTLRSGRHFRGHARHVSAVGLTRPTPQFLWQSMRFPKNSPDYKIWYESYKEEHDGLNGLDTYEVIDEAEYQRLVAKHKIEAIPTMCIHTVKTDASGRPERAKSRTVVLGNEEHRYWEKTDLYAPVIMKHSIRSMVAYAVSKGRRVKQCDAKNAFCHPTLPEDEVCVVTPPKGCPFSAPGTYWRLKKTLYGLRRSPRHWYKTFCKVLEDIGLTKCPHDPCVYKGQSPTGGTIFFGMYVDDCAYFGSDDATERWFERELGSRLKIDFMGDLSYYLGVHYVWGKTSDGRLTVHLSQAGQIHKMLDKHGMASPDSHYPVKTPFRSGLVIDSLPHDGLKPESKPRLVQQFQSLVGGFNWLSTSTRPDVTAVTSLLAGHLRNPSQGHLDSAIHVLRYLKGTTTWGIRYTEPQRKGGAIGFDPEGCLKGMVAWPPKEDGVPKLESFDRLDEYTDSNWGPQDASHPKPGQYIRDDDVKSLLGNLATYMGGPIDWKSVRERRISPSVCESEIKAMSEGHKMIMGLRHFFEDLDAKHVAEPTPFLYCDNQGSVTWVHSESVSRNMRQFNIRQCALREAVRHGEVKPVHIPGAINPADLFTKEMRDRTHFLQLRSALMSSHPTDVDGTDDAP